MRWIAAVGLSVVLWTSPVQAGLFDDGRFWSNVETREERVKFAKQIVKELHIKDLRRQIPRLSPAEKQWLKAEMAAGDDRLFRALESNERWIQQGRWFVDKVLFLAEAIQRTPKGEFSQFVELAYTLVDRGDTEYIHLLCKRKIISKCPFSSDAKTDLFSITAGMIGRRIILGVIGPQFGTGFSR